MPKFSAALPTPDTEGDFEEMCTAAGDGAAFIKTIEPAGEIVREMVAEAESAIRERLSAMTAATAWSA